MKPDHVVFGYSAETFWDGKQRSDAMFNKYNDMAMEIAGCGITFGAQAIQDAFALYPHIKKVGVISPYAPIGNQMVQKFLGDIGYEVVRMEGHASPGPVEIAHESFAKSRELVRRVDGDDVDCILQAGTNLAFAPLRMPSRRNSASRSWRSTRSPGGMRCAPRASMTAWMASVR